MAPSVNQTFATNDRVNLRDAAVIVRRSREALDRINALAARLDNGDAPAADLATANLTAGKPAFWSTSKHHNGMAGNLRFAVNQHASVRAAAAELGAFFRRDLLTEALLDGLLPLNAGAAADLADAYRAAGTFRGASELLARTARAEGTRSLTLSKVA